MRLYIPDPTDTPEEQWKPVVGYPGYKVSTLGRIYSSLTRRSIKNPAIDKRGYCRVVLCPAASKNDTKYLHRLVAEAFIPPVPSKPEVNHKDGNPTNNRVDNLERITHRDNINDAIKRRGGHWMAGVSSAATMRPICMIDPETAEQQEFPSMAEAIRWLSQKQIKGGGQPIPYLKVAGNITHAKDKPKLACGYVWASLKQENPKFYLICLNPFHRSPLAAILKRRRLEE